MRYPTGFSDALGTPGNNTRWGRTWDILHAPGDTEKRLKLLGLTIDEQRIGLWVLNTIEPVDRMPQPEFAKLEICRIPLTQQRIPGHPQLIMPNFRFRLASLEGAHATETLPKEADENLHDIGTPHPADPQDTPLVTEFRLITSSDFVCLNHELALSSGRRAVQGFIDGGLFLDDSMYSDWDNHFNSVQATFGERATRLAR